MSALPPPPDSNIPVQAETACGARIRVTPNTPSIHYSDEIVYFCGWDCKQLFDEDPLSSCIAARLLSGD
jgi:YHS domain-containing protein